MLLAWLYAAAMLWLLLSASMNLQVKYVLASIHEAQIQPHRVAEAVPAILKIPLSGNRTLLRLARDGVHKRQAG